MVVVQEACTTLPPDAWVFLFIVFIGLLVFNLSFRFRETKEIRWGWELTYGLLFLLGWSFWDTCRAHLWFPFSIIQSGLLIYVMYTSFWERKEKGL